MTDRHPDAEPTALEEEVAEQPSPDAEGSPSEPGAEAGARAPGSPADEPTESGTDESAEPDELTLAQQALEDRTHDLQRLQAEFVNYKRRVERDRELIKENATYAALAPIVDVLDTVDRAREHGDLDPGFQAVAEQLERTVERLGLQKFGLPGDAFDPTVHEALSHIGEDPDVEVTTCKVVAKAGYRIGERVVRAAQVLVVDPAAPTTA
ncbi:MAG: nucleotide exchange factor GrpE [Nocardioides sp.]